MLSEMRGFFVVCLWMIPLATGCYGAKENLVPVSGLVKMEGQPVAHVKIAFFPASSASGRGGSGLTNSEGTYEAVNSQRRSGLVPGSYEVRFFRPLQPDGTPPNEADPETMMVVAETLDPRSSVDQTSHPPAPIVVTISEKGTSSLNFEVYPKK